MNMLNMHIIRNYQFILHASRRSSRTHLLNIYSRSHIDQLGSFNLIVYFPQTHTNFCIITGYLVFFSSSN